MSLRDAMHDAVVPTHGYDGEWVPVDTAIEIAQEYVRDSQVLWMACPGRDATCPCQDGDACHYLDDNDKEGFGVPYAVVRRHIENAVTNAVIDERARILRRCESLTVIGGTPEHPGPFPLSLRDIRGAVG